jgi:SPP1 gp7 family putative phage head morphogenesis protein
MPEATPFNLPFQEAVDFFRSKGYAISPDSWRDVWQEAHAQAFTVARVTAMDVLVDVREGAQKAFDSGISLGEFKKDLIPTLQRKGWWKPEGENAIAIMPDGTVRKRLTPWRLETIYRTNTQSAYATGRWKQIQEVKDRRPYLQYKAIMDSKVRDDHAAMNDKVYPVDHPIWDEWQTPAGFNCRCYLKSLTAKQVESRGLKVESDIPKDLHPDEGWDYNKGKAGLDAWKPDLKKYDPAAQKALKNALANPPKAPEIQTPKWAPAKTVKEAEAWAKDNLGIPENRSKLNVDALNLVNKALFDLKQDFKLARAIKYYGEENGERVFASANPYYIFFNKKFFNSPDSFLETLKQTVKSGFHPIGTASPKAIVQHEFAHVLTNWDLNKSSMFFDIELYEAVIKIKSAYSRAMNKLAKSQGIDAMKSSPDFISEYAKKNADEFVAESFAMALNNDKPSSFARQVYDLMVEKYGVKK